MDLDELKQMWTSTQVRVERLEDRVAADRSRAALRWMRVREIVHVAAWFVFVLAMGSFWFDHRDTPHLLVAGLVLHLYGLAVVILGGVQLYAISRIDYSAPVTTLQSQLAALRRLRVRCLLALGVPWWCLWVPCVVVAAMWLANIDLYAASPAWVWASIGVGVIGILGSVALARHIADRPIASPRWRRIIDDLAGRSLSRAERALAEVGRFASE